MSFENYSLEVQHREHQLYRIKFNFPYSHEEVVNELKKEQWRKFSETNTTGYEIWPLRFKILRPQSKLLCEMQQFFRLESSKADVVDYLFETSPNIRGNYGLHPETGELVMSSIEEETTQVMENMKAVLEAAEMSFDNVVKTSIFISDMENFSKINSVYGKYFDDATAPARETVEVANLPKYVNVEISMIAIK